MNRAEKRRQKKLAQISSKNAKPGQISDPSQALAINNAIDLAIEYHSAGDLAKAENLYQQVLQLAPNHPVALQYLGVIAHQVGKNDIAVDLIKKALAIKPDYAEAHFNLANALKAMGKMDDAVASYNTAISIDPNYAGAHNNLGNTLKRMGKLDDAVASYNKALVITPDSAEAHNNLGNALEGLGKFEGAAASYAKALSLKPDYAEAHNNLGVAFANQEKLDDAVASYNKAIEIKPDYADAHNNLGNAYKQQGDLDGAIASYQNALAIKSDYADAHSNLGIALHAQGKLEEAIASFSKALAINPGHAEAYNNLGNPLLEQGKLDDAIASWFKALTLYPDFAEAHNNLGNAYKEQGKFDDAVQSCLKALTIDPNFAGAHNNLGVAYKEQGKLDQAIASFRKALAIKPDYVDAHSTLIFTQNYSAKYQAKQNFEEACLYGEKVKALARPFSHPSNAQALKRPLRIGLVSGDLRQHPVGYFLQGPLSELNSGSIEVFAYSTSPTEDDLSDLFKSKVSKWRTVIGITDEQLAMDIRDDEIDILVDLSGHTAKNRLPLFAWKPAPIQVTWLGYFATTGLEAMDYILCDEWTITPDEEANFTEKPWRLPESYLCFTPPSIDVDVGALPATKNGHITFGSFNNLTKVTDDVMACWAEILHGVAHSHLLINAIQLKEASVQKKVIDFFSAKGIPADRLTLEGGAGKSAYLNAYKRVDIALDPFPYGGVTTTMETLWMGVPLLTMQGERFISRAGDSILHNIGLSNWIAKTPQDYIAKGIDFASDLEALNDLRKIQRKKVLASPVCDAPRFARNLENAFHEMWKQRSISS